MSEQVVRSYVRVKHDKLELNEVPEQSNTIGYITLAGATTIFVFAYPGVALAIAALAGAAYGMKLVTEAPSPETTVEAATDAPNVSEKPKRAYRRRIQVNHYQLGKVKVSA
jgi:hypothetical protein